MTREEQDRIVAALSAPLIGEFPFSEAERAWLAYTEKLTREPWTVSTADVERLRATGADDRAIHDACAIVAYYAFVNRTADGLGVELEST